MPDDIIQFSDQFRPRIISQLINDISIVLKNLFIKFLKKSIQIALLFQHFLYHYYLFDLLFFSLSLNKTILPSTQLKIAPSLFKLGSSLYYCHKLGVLYKKYK